MSKTQERLKKIPVKPRKIFQEKNLDLSLSYLLESSVKTNQKRKSYETEKPHIKSYETEEPHIKSFNKNKHYRSLH